MPLPLPEELPVIVSQDVLLEAVQEQVPELAVTPTELLPPGAIAEKLDEVRVNVQLGNTVNDCGTGVAAL